jgi:hypothetical protein
MKLLSRKEIKESEQSAFFDSNKLATETAKHLKKMNLFLVELEQKKLAKIKEQEAFFEQIENEKASLIQAINRLKEEKSEIEKPIQITLDKAKKIKADAKDELDSASRLKELSLRQYTENIKTGKMLRDIVKETIKTLDSFIEIIDTNDKQSLLFQKTTELFPLLEELLAQKSSFKKEMSEYKAKIEEKIKEMDAEIATIKIEREKIEKEKEHIYSQQQAILAAKKHYKL